IGLQGYRGWLKAGGHRYLHRAKRSGRGQSTRRSFGPCSGNPSDVFISFGVISLIVQLVVVTGAAGFIGWHVAHFLEANGFDVIRSDLIRPQPAEDGWKKAEL